ncbi:nitroreductase family protein [Dysgonomonas sp. BGC7]|uniref:nitroreductase family protein n=1 Tax=Dysgonomonas sp. BGC7 TaxID=1658008 RepID=UPI000682A563|nr:nitroreductase family protein [Dysgonomonas sp. BGC7]MBD8389734.1 nitroreductase family protein [Dysgonomonas sp. BGC7]
MNLKELIEERYSVRAYLPQSVEREKIEYILECARLAPSASNNQPWKFYVVRDSAAMSKLYESYHREWFRTAPMAIVVCKDTSASWKRTASDGKDHSDIDAAIASEHICLAAASIGLGTCWICNFNPEMVSSILSLPAHIEPIAIFPIGYVDTTKGTSPIKRRKGIAEITEWI